MTHTTSRRHVVLGGLLTVMCGTCCTRDAFAQNGGTGCWIPESQTSYFFGRATNVQTFTSGNERIEPRSGDPGLDRALARSLASISRLFDVLPGFTYYHEDEKRGPNALASPDMMLDRTDGTVMFGLKLLKKLLNRPARPDASIIAVCAHEFGHIVSFKNGMMRDFNPTQTQPFRGEQFADYMAGYFAGTRKLEHPDFPAVAFAVTQSEFGGVTHGTGEQRGNAVQQGFLDAFQNKLQAPEAIQAGYQYSMRQSRNAT